MTVFKGTAALIAATIGLFGLGAAPAVASGSAGAATTFQTTPASISLTAESDPPQGWTVTTSGGTDHLVWAGASAVMGDARVQFFAGERLLGTPRPARDGLTYRLDVPTEALADPADLQVRAGGRRLDAAGVAALSKSRTLAESTAPTAATLPAVKVDPGKPGKYKTVSGEYTLPSVKLPDFPEPVEMQAVVVAPKGATGRRPLALFLHGRHSTCYGGSDDAGGSWPCPAGTKPIPSYRGYLRAQRLLASQGYVTVSISANGINGQDFTSEDGGAQARSSLIRLHLAKWAGWADGDLSKAPSIVRKSPPANLSKVLLMGHSRGGDGVNRAAIDSLTPPPSAMDGYHGPVRWKIRGTLLLAPTLFGHNPQADVPSVAVLPGCDGDVYDLQGEVSVDGTRGIGTGTALHSAAFVVGANHNYFNSEWTPGLAAAPAWDDWFEPQDKVCGTSKKALRLTPVQQQKVGATYIAAAARLFVQDDDRVLPLLDGSAVQASSVKPARVLSHAVGAARRPFVKPAANLKVTGAGKMKARLCREVSQGKSACIAPGTFVTVPHFVPFSGVPEEPERFAVYLKWSKAGGSGLKLQPAKPVSLTGSKSVAVRIIVPRNSKAKKFDVVIADSKGRKATLGRVSLTGLPGTEQTVGDWGQEVRVSLKAAQRAHLNLRKISRLQLIPRTSSGQAWLLDAWGYKSGTPVVRVAKTARIDVGTLGTVRETDSPTTIQMPVSVSGKTGGKIRIFVSDWDTGKTSTRLVTVPAGARRVDVPLRIAGDTKWGYGAMFSVFAKTVNGTVVGDFAGNLEIQEDDPAPTVTVTPIADKVSEGASLKWRLKLSAPAAVDIFLPMAIVPPAGAELSTTDVPASWVREMLGIEPLPSRPLSGTESFLFADILSGTTQVDIVTPTARDSLTEGAEQVRYQVQPVDGEPPKDPSTLPEMIGTVTDAP